MGLLLLIYQTSTYIKMIVFHVTEFVLSVTPRNALRSLYREVQYGAHNYCLHSIILIYEYVYFVILRKSFVDLLDICSQIHSLKEERNPGLYFVDLLLCLLSVCF